MGCARNIVPRRGAKRHRGDQGQSHDQQNRIGAAKDRRRQSGEGARHLRFAVFLRLAVVGHGVIHTWHVHRHVWLLDHARTQRDDDAAMIVGNHVAGRDQDTQRQSQDADQRSYMTMSQDKMPEGLHIPALRGLSGRVTRTFCPNNRPRLLKRPAWYRRGKRLLTPATGGCAAYQAGVACRASS